MKEFSLIYAQACAFQTTQLIQLAPAKKGISVMHTLQVLLALGKWI